MPKPIVLDADEVQELLPQVDALGTMRALFTDLGQGRAVQPPQTLTVFPENRGDFITYLGASTGRSAGVPLGAQIFGAKLSPYLVTAEKPVITAWTLLMSMATGQPLLLCDAGQLTTERTAATTALAVDLLARQGARRLAIIGSGKVAQAHLRYAAGVRDWAEIAVFSPGIRADHWQGLDPRLRIAPDADTAIAGADVVMLCTSSGGPVITTEALGPGVLVTSISTNLPDAHEVNPAFLLAAEVYCDHRATTPAAAGEMKLAARLGWDAAQIRGDLAGLSVGTCPLPSGERPVFFRSVGLGLEDVFIAQAIWAAATGKRG